MKAHPFSADRQIGLVYRVEGTLADVSFDLATRLPRSHFGETVKRGEVGEFLIIDVGGVGIFGRLLSVGTATTNVDAVRQNDRRVPAEGRLQLLSSLHMDGRAVRGISKHPRIGDPVYAASADAVMAILGSGSDRGAGAISIGRLSLDDSVVVSLPVSIVFGRHLAIVGATGSGKSWTLAHLVECVDGLNGKLVLIDATGEFHTLGRRARHIAIGAAEGEPDDTTLVGVPHFMMRETDRNAFLNPSAGSQLPKLREAVRSLKLAHAIECDPSASRAHSALVEDGRIVKADKHMAPYLDAVAHYASAVEDEGAQFSLRKLAAQIQCECVWATSPRDPSKFGGVNQNELGYVSTLVSRLNDLLQLDEVMSVIDPPSGIRILREEMNDWWLDGEGHILRISLRNVTFAHHLREIVVNIIGQMLLRSARKGTFRDMPLIVAIDEAHQFFDVTVGEEYATTRLNAFDSIAKEGRKYGLTTCAVTQRPSDLPSGVLSQVGMTIVHRLADGRDRQKIEQAAAELDHSATRLLPGLVPGEAVLMGVDFPIPVSVRIQRPIAPPSSAGPNYDAWAARYPQAQGAG